MSCIAGQREWLGDAYVEILAVELLDELEHHSVDCTLPHLTVRAEALDPCRLTALVFGANSNRQLFKGFLDDRIVFWDTVDVAESSKSFLIAAGSK